LRKQKPSSAPPLTDDERERLDLITAELRRRTAQADSYERECAFIESLMIEDKVSGGLIPFALWPFQREFLESLRSQSSVFVLKARQLGITWLCLAHLLYLGYTGGHRLFLIASQSGSDAIDALHRLRIMYNSIENPSVGLTVDNTEQIALANGSRFESMMATKRAGRGKAAYATFADEFAFFSYPDEQMAALGAASQRMYVATTGNGPSDLANTMWEQGQRDEGKFKCVFYPWHAHPDRDAAWYAENVTQAPNQSLAEREYAATPEDAFRMPSGNYFRAFTTTGEQANVREFGLVTSWPVSLGVDFGFVHPFCVVVQTSPSGQPFVVAEYGPEEITSPEFAAGIQRTLSELQAEEDVELVLPLGPMYCDPAGKARNMQTSQSEFDVMVRAGFRPHGKPSGVRDGCDLMMIAIAHAEIPLVVHPRCVKLIRALSQMPPDPKQPDVYLQKHPTLSHPLDALRYWFVNNRGHRGEFTAPEPGRRRIERIF